MPSASWCVGSIGSLAATTITVTANATQEVLTVSSAAQGFYLYNGGGSYDILAALETALESHSQITTATAVIRRDLITSVTCDVAWTIDAWSNTDVTDLTGLPTTSGSSTAHTSQNISLYLWSPGKLDTPSSRIGTVGDLYKDTAVVQSGTRVIVSRQNNTGYTNRFTWERIRNSRFRSSSEVGGEYANWWDYVQSKFYRFKVWRGQNEDTSSTTAVTWGTELGPYKWLPPKQLPHTFPHNRDLGSGGWEDFHTVTLPVVKVDEYS